MLISIEKTGYLTLSGTPSISSDVKTQVKEKENEKSKLNQVTEKSKLNKEESVFRWYKNHQFKKLLEGKISGSGDAECEIMDAVFSSEFCQVT